MKRRTLVMLGLLVTAVGLFLFVEAFYLPHQEAQQAQYQAEQRDPLTHHLDEVLPYRHPYMGNASNLSQLFGHLPLQDLSFTFQLYPDQLTAELIFETAAADVNEVHLQRSLLYNSTAAFALIDNLEHIQYRFSDTTYMVDRSGVISQYGEPSALLDAEIWQTEVQEPLQEHTYVQESWARLVQLKPN